MKPTKNTLLFLYSGKPKQFFRYGILFLQNYLNDP